MAKLNKTQLWETVQEVITEHQDLFKKGKEAALIDALALYLAPKVVGSTSNKYDEDGNIYCSYFKEYRPADQFNFKLSKADSNGNRRQVPKSNCKEAETIIRRVRAATARMNREITDQLRNKEISSGEAIELFEFVDSRSDEQMLEVTNELFVNKQRLTPGYIQ